MGTETLSPTSSPYWAEPVVGGTGYGGGDGPQLPVEPSGPNEHTRTVAGSA